MEATTETSAASTQGAGATNTSAATETTSTSSTSWVDGLGDDLKSYVQTKGWQDPKSVLESYKNLEKLRGVPQERLLKLPETPDAPEWNEVYQKLGRPDTPDGYGLKAAEDGGDEGFINWAKETFHGLNITKPQAENLIARFNEYVAEKQQTNDTQQGEKLKSQEMALKKEWGQAYEQNLKQAKSAVQAFGVPQEAVDALESALGFDGTIKLMSEIGSKLSEDSFVSGQTQNTFGQDGGILAPAQAIQRIKALKGDPEFTKKYLAGDVSARERMTRLHKMAYPDD